MGILSWIVLGLVAGWIAKFFMPISGGIFKTLILGVVGALVGGYISTLLGWGSVTGFNFFSLLIAVVGALIVIFVFRLVSKK